MRQFLFFVTVLLCNCTKAQLKIPTDARIKHFVIHSRVLNMDKKFVVVEPNNYEPDKEYPLLFLFHSLNKGDSTEFRWVGLTNIVKNTADIPFIIVTPGCDSTFITNTDKVRNEDYFFKELPDYIFSNYKIDKTRIGAAGASMGGTNSLLFGLRHPELIRFVGDINGAVVKTGAIENIVADTSNAFAVPSMLQAFGTTGHRNREEYDVIHLIAKADTAKAPYIFSIAGIQDQFSFILPLQREMAEALSSKQMRYEYHEVPGRHRWRDWDWEVMEVIRCMRKVLTF